MPDNPEPPPSPPPVSPPPQFQPPPGPAPGEIDARRWNMFCHLSALSGFVVPLGNILGPLLIWQIKKHEIPSVEVHGKAALNFQITVLIVVVGGLMVTVPLSVICIGYLFIPVILAAALCGIILPIIAGVKANDGIEYKYPFSFELIK